MAIHTGPARGRGSGVPRGTKRTANPARRPVSPTRHPLVAAAMVLPLAVVLAVAFGAWSNLVVQVTRAAELMGR